MRVASILAVPTLQAYWPVSEHLVSGDFELFPETSYFNFNKNVIKNGSKKTKTKSVRKRNGQMYLPYKRPSP